MVINYHTGIKMLGYHGYGGIRMYAGYQASAVPTGEVMSVGNGDYNVRVMNRLYAGDALCIRGDCRTSWPSGGGGTGYRDIYATAGSGNNGIIWPDNPFGGGGDDAWIRYYRDGSGEDTALQIGIANDAHDEIELYSAGEIELQGPGGNPLGFEFPNNRWGGGGDTAWIRYYQDAGGENTRLQIGIENDDHDEIELWSNAYIRIAGPGTSPIGFQFQSDRWGGGSDQAYLRYRRDGGGEDTTLELGVENDGHDNLRLRGGGAELNLEGGRIYANTYLDARDHLCIRGSCRSSWPSSGGTAGEAACPGGWNGYGDICFYNDRRRAQEQTLVGHWCHSQLGGHLCTDDEVVAIRGWRGWFGGNFWYGEMNGDDSALFHNCNCGGYWYNHDGGAHRSNNRYAYCCRNR